MADQSFLSLTAANHGLP